MQLVSISGYYFTNHLNWTHFADISAYKYSDLIDYRQIFIFIFILLSQMVLDKK